MSDSAAVLCPIRPLFPYRSPVHVAFINVNPVNPIGAHKLYSTRQRQTHSVLMAKGASSKDKKSGEKGKGKTEETADKGGKVRAYSTTGSLLCFVC